MLSYDDDDYYTTIMTTTNVMRMTTTSTMMMTTLATEAADLRVIVSSTITTLILPRIAFTRLNEYCSFNGDRRSLDCKPRYPVVFAVFCDI